MDNPASFLGLPGIAPQKAPGGWLKPESDDSRRQ
jgi:hypothetical protein